jgi:O-antigen/teichoic acid export membrane protein
LVRDINNNTKDLTHPSILAHNTIYNLLGQVSPILVAILTIPLLIKGLGNERFGVLTLVWMVIGYYSIFDFGLSQALTILIAQKLGTGHKEQIPNLFWTGLLLVLIIGLIWALIFYLITPLLVNKVLKIQEGLIPETKRTFFLISFCIPIVISNASLRGVLEAQQRFDLTNLVRVLQGIFNYIGPLIGLVFSRSIFTSVLILMIVRFGSLIAHLLFCFHTIPDLRFKWGFKSNVLKQLVGFGSWMSLSNIIGPLMVSIDRFLISSLISIEVLAYYTTPYEMVTKLLIIPGAFLGVFFPAFSTSFVQNHHQTQQLFNRVFKYIFIFIFPAALLLITFAYDGLNFWIDNNFAQNSALVFQLLTCCIFFNCLALVPYSLIQATGRPDLTGKINLFELPVYFLLAWYLIKTSGIEGAAIAWLIRIIVDMVILYIFALKILPANSFTKLRLILSSLITIFLFYFAFIITGLFGKTVYIFSVLFGFGIVVWRVILTPEEILFLKRLFIKKIA